MVKSMFPVGDMRVPILLWLDDIEEEALEQAKNLSKLPFVFRQVAVMPDAQKGYGMPIGGVLATEQDVIIPNAVGSDINCGMCAVRTSIVDVSKNELKQITSIIRENVPVGTNRHKKPPVGADVVMKKLGVQGSVVDAEYDNALHQLGTLGSGNHFIGIKKGSDNHVWIMLHSGSRNLGYRVAERYNAIAKELNYKWRSSVPKEYDLAFLPTDTKYGRDYITEMNYCKTFARANRMFMMTQCQFAITEVRGLTDFGTMLDVQHNYATIENHFGKNVMVHRKGATRARKGELGIIPGDQGSHSYIVMGLGNRDSFTSCSHGAGRAMSIKKAKQSLDFDEEVKKLDDMGVIHTLRSKEDLGESSGAYKDISVVMENQTDLVEIAVELTPLATIKGKTGKKGR